MNNPFKLLGISDDVVNAVKDLGFESPTPKQEQERQPHLVYR
jgi:ATP-dependent RNA helicase DeaD